MNIRLVPPDDPTWNSVLDRIGQALDAPNNPALLPYHFLSVTLARIGGWLLLVEGAIGIAGAGFLLPRGFSRGQQGARRQYTLRYHALPGADIAPSRLEALVGEAVGADLFVHIPTAPQRYRPTHQRIGPVDIGRPDAAEAAAIRDLHQQIWGSPAEFLYPTDLHSEGFRAGTSLVARVDGRLAGFLFGFYSFGGPPLPADWHERTRGDLRLESQTMGVHPDYRGMRLAFLLKRIQAEGALAEGIGVVHWTADPLQYPNAALNFGLLRAVAFDFYPDLYPFRNDLNRVHASRFALTWLVGSRHVQGVSLTGSQALILDLGHHAQVVKVNRGWRDVDYTIDAPMIAVEVPANWTLLQQDALSEALAWRQATDRIFVHYVGRSAGQYVVTGVGVDGERRYLIGEQVNEALWSRLGRA